MSECVRVYLSDPCGIEMKEGGCAEWSERTKIMLILWSLDG